MKIMTIRKIARPVTAVLIPLLAMYTLGNPVAAQERPGEKGRLENFLWHVEGNVAVITYDLLGDPAVTYDVSITLRRLSDTGFQVIPRSLTGSIGKGKFAGRGREIRWEFKQDVSQELEGSDYVFDLEINIVQEWWGGNTLYYVAAGLGVAGGVAAILLGGKKGDSGAGVPGLPNPPLDIPPSN